MIDVYRSTAGRESVARWCDTALEAWPVEHTSLHLDVVPATGTLAEEGAERALGDAADVTVPTHVVETGSLRRGSPLYVLVPDAGSCAASLGHAAAALSAGGPVWVVDVPGQPGLSTGLHPRRGVPVWTAAWLDAVLGVAAHAGVTDVVLVGHSAGALPVLGARSGIVRGRVLVAPAGVIPFRVGPRMARDSARWLMRATPATSAAVARHLVGPEQPGEPAPEVVDWLTTVGASCRSQGAPRPVPAFVLDRAFAEPCAVVVGDDDCYLPAAGLGAAISRRAPGADVAVLPRCGHVLTPAHWATVAEIARGLDARTDQER